MNNDRDMAKITINLERADIVSLKKFCIDARLTMRELILRYIRYLEAQEVKKELHAKSKRVTGPEQMAHFTQEA